LRFDDQFPSTGGAEQEIIARVPKDCPNPRGHPAIIGGPPQESVGV
jgi:hypothetical protein